VIDEITDDLASPVPMHRLLQGDVGAGKTVVAVAALLVALVLALGGVGLGLGRGVHAHGRQHRQRRDLCGFRHLL
jgi:hypothetical protein